MYFCTDFFSQIFNNKILLIMDFEKKKETPFLIHFLFISYLSLLICRHLRLTDSGIEFACNII